MKKKLAPGYLAPGFLVLGVIAQSVYRWLYTLVEDPVSGLLPGFTAAEWVLWALVALAAVGAFLFTGKTALAPAGRLAGVGGNVLFALGAATLLLEPVQGPAGLLAAYRVLCVLAVVCLLVMAFLRGTGRKVPFLLELGPCLMCIVLMLECYQLWSEVPQLTNYVLGLGAVLCLALEGYFRLARAAGLPEKSWYHAIGLLGIFFCAAAVAQGDFTWFFTTAAVWLAGTYAGLRPGEN